MAFEIKLSSIIVMISLSKYKGRGSLSIAMLNSIFFLGFSSLYLRPTSVTNAARLSLLTQSFLFCVSVLRNSSIWLIKFKSRMALL